MASIRPSNADTHSSGIQTGHGRLDARNVTLKRCLIGAYGVGPHQIIGGPDWLSSDRYDILAKADQPIDDDAELMAMLQTLLAERFKLALHHDTKMLPAFVLEVAKTGPKLQKAEGGTAKTDTSSGNKEVTISARNIDMDHFANVLARQMDLPVVNATGLSGSFDIKLHWTPDSAKQQENGSADDVSIFQEQLGLRLHSQKALVPVLVIDHIERVPTEN